MTTASDAGCTRFISLCGNHFPKVQYQYSFFFGLHFSVCISVDNWMCMILNDVLMSAYVHMAPSITHFHIQNKHKHAQSRFMHGIVPDPFKARGSYKVYLVMQGYCALFFNCTA